MPAATARLPTFCTAPAEEPPVGVALPATKPALVGGGALRLVATPALEEAPDEDEEAVARRVAVVVVTLRQLAVTWLRAAGARSSLGQLL